MNKKWILLAFTLAVFGLLGLRIGWGLAEFEESPKATDGIMDLRDRDPASGVVIPLQGEWSFYPNRFIEPGGVFPQQERRSLHVPGAWDDVFSSPFGYGTYRLVLLLPESGNGAVGYALQPSIIRTAHSLYINGKLAGHSGQPGADKAAAKPRVVPYIARFESAGGAVELVLHVSNFHYASAGGMFQNIQFGTGEAIERQYGVQFGQNASLMGFLLVCCLFFLMLYSFRRHKELLYFSLFFGMTLLFWLTHNERLLFIALPDMSYEMQSKLQSIPSALIYFSLFGVVRSLFPQHFRAWFIKAAGTVTLAFTVFYMAAPVTLSSRTELVLMGFDLLMVISTTVILVKEYLRGSRHSVSLLLAASCIILESLSQSIFFFGIETSSRFLPLLKAIFALVMIYILTKRFFVGWNEVETLSKKLIVADRLKNDFLATTSRELRLPLHGMINIADAMLGDPHLERRQSEQLSLLMATGRRLSHLLDDMLDLSKLNEGALELERGRVDIRVLVSGVADVMRYLKNGSSIRFENQSGLALPMVWADEHRLTQVLFHLFHYAFKWGALSEVRVEVRSDASPDVLKIAVFAQRQEDRPGDGPSEETVFAAASDLSLDISRKLIGLHGSELTVADSGTALQISFLLHAAPEETKAAPAIPAWLEAAAGMEIAAEGGAWRHIVKGAPRVLVVDDDPVSLRVLFDILVQEKLDVTALTSGSEALQRIEKEGEWDLIVLEAMLPQLSGYDICRKIRERHSFYDLPVMFLTSRNLPAFLLLGFDAGANDYMTKPIAASEFLARIRTLLHMKQSVRERLDMEMALIQAQIKPHFLFNTLNTIASLSETDPDRTRELLAEFGVYLQSSFDLRNLDRKVPFEKEWKLVQSYLNIEKARFGERIQVAFDLPGPVSVTLPPLTLQPIVENALRHGVLKKLEGGRLHIAVTPEPGFIRIAVRDNGAGMPPEKRAAVLAGTYRGGIGLVNVNRRLKNAYVEGISIESAEGAGTLVSFRIPAVQPREERSNESDRNR